MCGPACLELAGCFLGRQTDRQEGRRQAGSIRLLRVREGSNAGPSSLLTFSSKELAELSVSRGEKEERERNLCCSMSSPNDIA